MFTRIKVVRIARQENKAAILNCYSIKLFQRRNVISQLAFSFSTHW